MIWHDTIDSRKRFVYFAYTCDNMYALKIVAVYIMQSQTIRIIVFKMLDVNFFHSEMPRF